MALSLASEVSYTLGSHMLECNLAQGACNRPVDSTEDRV